MNITKDNVGLVFKSCGWEEVEQLPYLQSTPRYNKLFTLNGFVATFSSTYYIIVNGQVPYSKAEKLYQLHGNKGYEIRANGTSEEVLKNLLSNDILTDYSNTLPSYLDNFKEWSSKMEDMSSNLWKYNKDFFYVNTYHIDTIRGFELFTKFIKQENITSSWFN